MTLLLINAVFTRFINLITKHLSAMATIVQSRFAGLRIEDDDFPAATEKSKKPRTAAATAAKKTEAPKKAKISKTPAAQNGNGGKKKNKKPAASEQQWEQWRQKDEEMVDGAYEAELTQAILLSKLDYEERKDVYKVVRKQAEMERRLAEQAAREQGKPGQKKQKKKNVMSLEQFNDMVSGDDSKRLEERSDSPDPAEEPAPTTDTEFFERVQDEAQTELRKDKHKDRVMQRQPPSNEVINKSQFAEALDRKNKEIADLNDEVIRLKEELLTVKSRNKKLCNILGQGEMRDKAEALAEVERLRQVQSELTAEVASLHAQLEQERSRHPDPRAKDKKKKSAPNEKEK